MGGKVLWLPSHLEVEKGAGKRCSRCREECRCLCRVDKLLDDRSLALIMHDSKDDGKKALQILKEHYMSQGKPKVIALYTELTTLEKGREESTTLHVIRAEAAAAALKNSGETIGDSLLIAMILKGLPSTFNSFKTVVTQNDKQPTFQQFKVTLHAYEESEHSNTKSDSVMKLNVKRHFVERKLTLPR